MNPSILNMVANRLSLRQPQRESLEILAEVCDLIPMEKGADTKASLASIRAKYPHVEDFEREFPSLCFSLATGVGKLHNGPIERRIFGSRKGHRVTNYFLSHGAK